MNSCFSRCFLFGAAAAVFFSVAAPANAAVSHTITSSSWNVRIDGELASDALGRYKLAEGDFNNDGYDDIIVTTNSSYSGRTSLSVTYLIDSTILNALSGTGNTLDLANTSNYTIKIVGAVTGDFTDYYPLETADLNGNGKTDLIISHGYADHGGVSNRGAVYVIYDSILDDYTGTGNILDLSDTSKFNVKFVGAAADDNLGYSTNIKDLNGDSAMDLIMVADHTDFNTRTNSGSAYLVYNSLLSTFSGTGNVVDVSTSTNYNIRVDASSAGSSGVNLQSYIVSPVSDVNSDGISDLVVLEPQTDINAANSGSAFVLYSTLLDDYTGTGNTIDLATSSNFNLRFDGPMATGGLGYSLTQVGDLNDNGLNDLVLVDSYTNLSGFSNSGSVYLIYDSIIDDYTGTGNTINLNTSSNYTIRIDGGSSSAFLGEDAQILDYDNDGINDLKIDSPNKSKTYFINSSILSQYSGTGNLMSSEDPNDYSILYTTVNTMISTYAPADINGDSKIDFLYSSPFEDNNSRNNSGSIFLIYNFPHTISANTPSLSGPTLTIQGTVSAPNSATPINGVQFQQGSNSISGTWNSCTANDGAFDSTSEAYTCSFIVNNVSDYTIYIRAFDQNTSYTPQAHYLRVASGSTSSSNSGPTTNIPSCQSANPTGHPDLFQINRHEKFAKLFFAPVSDTAERYHVVYGFNEGEERFGSLSEQVSLGSNTGVFQMTISDLDPKQTYWFKVAPANGCAVGNWSNWLKAGPGKKNPLFFYRYLGK